MRALIIVLGLLASSCASYQQYKENQELRFQPIQIIEPISECKFIRTQLMPLNMALWVLGCMDEWVKDYCKPPLDPILKDTCAQIGDGYCGNKVKEKITGLVEEMYEIDCPGMDQLSI